MNNPLFSSVQKFALSGLSDLIRVLMENIDDSLFDLSEKSQSDRERNMYFEAMREIRIKRNMLQLGFDQAMEACFQALMQNKLVNAVEIDPDELSLVELDDIEDSIAVDNMISKARPSFEDDLFAVVERLKVILQRQTIDDDLNPFDPKAICNSFHKASDILDTDIQIKLIFYKLFDKYVMSNLGQFYAEMNEFFIRKNVLPDFKASSERIKQTAKFMANRVKGDSQATQAAAVEASDPGLAQLTEALQPTGNDGGLLAVLQQALSNHALPSGAIPLPAGTGVAGGQTTSIQMPEATVKATLTGGGQAAVPGATGLAVNQTANAYLSALTDMQVSNLQAVPVADVDPKVFKQEMQQQLVSFSQANQHQSSTADNQIINIVSMLFDFFLDDDALPDPIKVLIGRLQIPILKAAIIDHDFFNQKKHPARQLLDSISKASLGWNPQSGQEQGLVEEIESLVDFVLTEFEQDIGVFEQALLRFNQYLNTEAEKLEQAEAQVAHQEQDKDRQIYQAQQAASELVESISKHQELSFEVSDFLETIWSSVLFHVYLSLGESSNHWKNLRHISSTLIWTLVPKFSEEDRLKILKTLPSLLRALSKGMELVKISTEAQNRIFSSLAQEHSRVVKQTSKNIVTRIDDKTVWPDDTQIADAFAQDAEPESIDFEIDSVDEDDEADLIDALNTAPTASVIGGLEDFTSSIKSGDIEVDEEITIGGYESTSFDQATSVQSDDFLQQAQALEIGGWVEFKENNGNTLNTRLSWKSKVTGKLVFVNRQGAKVKNMSVNNFAIELRSGRAKMIQTSSVFDRAVNSLMSKIKT